MKRWFPISLLLLLLLVFSPAAYAQDNSAPIWFYAYDADTSEMTAFTADGDSRRFAVAPNPVSAFRIDSERLLMTAVNADDAYQVAVLSPDGLKVITTLDNAGNLSLLPVAYAYPHVVLATALPLFQPYTSLLVNIEAGSATEITTSTNVNCCAFSEDGTELRYMGVPVRDGAQTSGIALYTRDLTSGETTEVSGLLTGQPEPTSVRLADGEQWLVQESRVGVVNTITTYLFDLDGSTTLLAEQSTDQEEPFIQYQALGDYLVSWPLDCSSGCTLTLDDIRTETTQTIDLPEILGVNRIERFAYISDEALVFEVDFGGYIRIGQAQLPQYLGHSEVLTIPNNRWSVLFNVEDDIVRVWDFEQSDALAVKRTVGFEGLQFIVVSMTPTHTVIADSANRSDTQLTINRETGVVVDWYPALDGSAIVRDVVSDDQVIVQAVPDSDLEQGIYLYTASTGDFTPLLLGTGRFVAAQPLMDIAP